MKSPTRIDTDPPTIGLWRPGDIVTRDGTDEHLIVSINAAGDLIEVECVVAPSEPWTRVGEREHNLARRYTWLRTGPRLPE